MASAWSSEAIRARKFISALLKRLRWLERFAGALALALRIEEQRDAARPEKPE
jgi:hypothetical protein